MCCTHSPRLCLYLNLLGDFQISNVSTAIAVATNLKQFNITKANIAVAIKKIRSEGRLQNITHGKLRNLVSINNDILIDGAHNLLAAIEIKKYLKTLDPSRKIFMVLGMMSNKEHKKFIEVFKEIIHSIIVVDIPNQINFIKKEKLLNIAKTCGIHSEVGNSIEDALKNASNKNTNAIIFCTGSLYLAGEILNLN